MSTEVEAVAVANCEPPSEPDTSAVAAQPIEQDDPIAAAFFQRPDRPVIDISEELLAIHSMSRSSRRAMWATIGMFSLSFVCIGGYAGYHNIIMPVPAPLGEAADHAVLPIPLESPRAAATPATPAPLRLHATLSAPARTEAEGTDRAERASAEPRSDQAVVHGQAERASSIAATAARPAETAAHRAPEVRAAAPTAPSEPAAARPVSASNRAEGGAVEASNRAEGGAVEASNRAEAGAAEATGATAAESGTQPPTHDELLAVGRELSRKNRLTEAVEAFQRALIQAPDSSAALSGLSYVYLNASDLPRARDFAERSVDADATNSEGWIVLGAARELLGDRSGALAAYRTCVAQGKGRYLSQCRQVAR